MKVLVYPPSKNPYQSQLYGAMASMRPLSIRYLTGPTASHTVNLVMLPIGLATARVLGYRVLHIHWVYEFNLPWTKARAARRLVRRWYSSFLRLAKLLGFQIVWTAHNLVPHEPVFDDDVEARRELVSQSTTVIAHDAATEHAVRTWGALDVVSIPQGIAPPRSDQRPDRPAACAALGFDESRRRALFFGLVREYKGVDLLLDAVAAIEDDHTIDVVIVGRCEDSSLRSRLEHSASSIGSSRVHVRFEYVSDDVLELYLACSDIAVFPFRRITNSSSVATALGAGLPVVIPALSVFADVPRNAAFRFGPDGGSAAIADALTTAALLDGARLQEMSSAAQRVSIGRSWADVAEATWQVFDRLFAAPDAPADAPLTSTKSGATR